MRNEREPSRKSFIKHCVAGIGLPVGDFIASQWLGLIGGTESLAFGLMNPAIVDHQAMAVWTTIGIGLGVSTLTSIQNLRLNHEFGVSTNGIGTLLYNAINKKWPSKTKFRDWTVGASQVLLTKDWIGIVPALANDKIAGVFVGAKALTTGYNLAKVVASEVALRKIKAGQKEKKAETKTKKSHLVPKGVIFALASVRNSIFPK